MEPLKIQPPAGLGLSAQACVDCHTTQHADWAGSRHASAATNALFTASFARQTRAWCLNCHAPLVEQRTARLTLTELGKEGVTCAACHVRDGQVLSSKAPSAEGRAAHPMAEAPALRSAAFCANCHDFNVPWVNLPKPVARHGYSEVPMQDTFDEWKGSSAAAQPCVACHGAHAVTGARDVAWLRKVLKVEAQRVKGGVQLTLTASGLGHAFPTGDPFRALRFEVCEGTVCTEKRVRRSFAEPVIVPAPTKGTASTYRVLVPAAGSRWRLIYTLGEPELTKAVPQAEREVELLSGTL